MELLFPSFSFSILLGGWINPWFVGVAWCCGGCEESQVWNFKGIVLKIGTNSQGFWSNVCLVLSFFDSRKRFKWGMDFGVCVKCCSSKSIKGMFEKRQIHVGDEFLWVDPFVTSWWIAAALRLPACIGLPRSGETKKDSSQIQFQAAQHDQLVVDRFD